MPCKPPVARQTHYRVVQAVFSLVDALRIPHGHVWPEDNINKIIVQHVGKKYKGCIYEDEYKFVFHIVTFSTIFSPA